MLVAEERVLQRDDIDVGIDAGLITAHLQVERALRGLDREALLLDLLGIDACLGQIVLDLLKGGEHGLPVGGDVGVVDGDVLMQLGAKRGVENGLRKGRSDGPETAGPVSNALEERTFKPAARR